MTRERIDTIVSLVLRACELEHISASVHISKLGVWVQVCNWISNTVSNYYDYRFSWRVDCDPNLDKAEEHLRRLFDDVE